MQAIIPVVSCWLALMVAVDWLAYRPLRRSTC